MEKNGDYVQALCAVNERNLIKVEGFEKLLTMSYEEAIKYIKDYGFGKGIESSDGEELISKEEENLLHFIEQYSPKTNFIKFKLLPNDYRNAEGLVRSKNLGVDEGKFVSREGNISIQTLREYVYDGKGKLSVFLMRAIDKAQKLFDDKMATGAAIGYIFLKEKYAEFMSLIKANKKILDAVKTEIDLLNYSMALRSQDKEYIENGFIEGGYIKLEEVLKLLSNENPNNYLTSKYKDAVKEAMAACENGKPLTSLERFKDSYLLSLLMKDKYTVQGYDRFYLYVYYKENEIKNVRTVLVGLKAGIDKNEIRARMRSNYAG